MVSVRNGSGRVSTVQVDIQFEDGLKKLLGSPEELLIFALSPRQLDYSHNFRVSWCTVMIIHGILPKIVI